MAGRVLLVFRYDDYSEPSPTDLEVELAAMFERHGLAVTYGVVPFSPADGPAEPGRWNLDAMTDEERRTALEERIAQRATYPVDPIAMSPEKAAAIRPAIEAGTVEIALHGMTHEALVHRPGYYSEFAGLPGPTQGQRLEKGRGCLWERFGLVPSTFIPPWNRYDGATLELLGEMGFTAISAGRTGPTCPGHDLRYLPSTVGPGQLDEAIEAARAAGASGQPTPVVVMLHDYDFLERSKRWGKMTMTEFDERLSRLAEEPDIVTATIADAAKRGSDLDAERFQAFSGWHEAGARRLLPPGWAGALDRPLLSYGDMAQIDRSRRENLIRAATLYGATLLGALALGILLGIGAEGAPVIRTAARWFATVATAGLIGLALRGELHARGALVATAALGLMLGLWIA